MCTVLFGTVLFCTVLFYTIQLCTAPFCTILFCIVLHCTVLYCSFQCTEDTLSISPAEGPAPPLLCGNLTGQHIYTRYTARRVVPIWYSFLFIPHEKIRTSQLFFSSIEVTSRVSKCHHLAVMRRGKILLTLRKVLRFLFASWKIHDFIHFLNSFVHFYPLYKQVSHFLVQSKILTAHKNPL